MPASRPHRSESAGSLAVSWIGAVLPAPGGVGGSVVAWAARGAAVLLAVVVAVFLALAIGSLAYALLKKKKQTA